MRPASRAQMKLQITTVQLLDYSREVPLYLCRRLKFERGLLVLKMRPQQRQLGAGLGYEEGLEHGD